MTQEERTIMKEAIRYVVSHYGSDFPYYVKFVMNKFNELKDSYDTER